MQVLNQINLLYYSKVKNAFEDGGPANFFTHLEPINFAFFRKIEKLIPNGPVHLMELCSGGSPRRWENLREFDSKRTWDITLTDFSTDFLPDIEKLKTENLRFKTEKVNLLMHSEILKRVQDDRILDVILVTYGFDSVWFPEDMHLEKINNVWFKANYLIEGDSSISLRMTREQLEEKDFEKIEIIKKLEKINLNNLKYGKIIEERYNHLDSVKVNFPGGLITKVQEAFKVLLKDSGIFISGDIAVDDKTGIIKSDNANYPDIIMDDYITVGKVAKAKIEDYGIAKVILEMEGFKVDLKNVMDFVEEMGEITPINVTDHQVMVVSKK